MNSFFLECPASVTFPELLSHWSYQLNELQRKNSIIEESFDVVRRSYTIKITAEQLAQFAQLFNSFVATLALQAQQHNWWQSSYSTNIFASFDTSRGELINGYAFVPQWREQEILCRLFYLNDQCNSERLTVYENATARYRKENPSSAWSLLDNLFTHVFALSSILRLSLKDGYDELSVEQLLPYLHAFDEQYDKIKALSTSNNSILMLQASAFYPLSDPQLNKLSGEQLACICLEEIKQNELTSLLYRILRNNDLWAKITTAFVNESFAYRIDNSLDKMNYLTKFRAIINVVVQEQHEKESKFKKLKKEYEQANKELDRRNSVLHQCLDISAKKDADLRKKEAELRKVTQKIQKSEEEIQQLKACIENNGMLIKIKLQTADLAFLFYTINLIKNKAEELQLRKCAKAQKAANDLVDNLNREIDHYLEHDISLETLKAQCRQHVQEAYPQLAQWRGWKQILVNTLLCIAGLGVGYVVAGAINYAVNKQFTFFNNTKSVDLLDDLSSFLKPTV